MTEACAEIVARDDPHLHATALFSPKNARWRLMVLYAFDCELSRATRASSESMIPRMRLQWWRDVLERARGDAPPPAHEVAGPLTHLIRRDPSLLSDMAEFPGRDVLSQMIDGHEAGLDAPFSADEFTAWAGQRFGARLGLAGSILPAPEDQGRVADCSAATRTLALGMAFRTAHRMAAETGRTLLPDLRGADLAAFARGEMTGAAAEAVQGLATSALTDLKALRKSRRLKGLALIAHLPVRREALVLRRVARDPGVLVGKLDDVDRPFDGLRLAIAAWRGRW